MPAISLVFDCGLLERFVRGEFETWWVSPEAGAPDLHIQEGITCVHCGESDAELRTWGDDGEVHLHRACLDGWAAERGVPAKSY